MNEYIERIDFVIMYLLHDCLPPTVVSISKDQLYETEVGFLSSLIIDFFCVICRLIHMPFTEPHRMEDRNIMNPIVWPKPC